MTLFCFARGCHRMSAMHQNSATPNAFLVSPNPICAQEKDKKRDCVEKSAKFVSAAKFDSEVHISDSEVHISDILFVNLSVGEWKKNKGGIWLDGNTFFPSSCVSSFLKDQPEKD